MIAVAILTVSDSTSEGTREDVSGPLLRAHCEELEWPVVATSILPDDEASISQQLIAWADGHVASVILTIGGTGISSRDNTPEATRKVLEREMPGVSELIRSEGRQQTPYSVLSRGLAGVRKHSFILNLPGSPAGALHSLKTIEMLVPHVLNLLAGNTAH